MGLAIRVEHTDPAGLDGRRFPQTFDPRPHRNLGMPTLAPVPGLPDDQLISTLVAYGMPRHAAEQLRSQPVLRFRAAHFWCLVQDSHEGDPQAREMIDYMRWCWEESRRQELISEDQSGADTVGLMER